MTKFFTVLSLLCLSLLLPAQAILNMELQSHITYGNKAGSGCWGHTDKNGIEYAIIGVLDGIRIYSLEDPKNPIERLFIPGVENRWREIRTWGEYIYVTTEGPDGVTVIDATQAPESFNYKRWFPEIPNGGILETHHSINLDTLGYLYINGTNVQPKGVLLFNLNNDPYNPEFVANIGNVYTHDCYANAEYLYTCDLGNGVAIYDIKEKSNPVFLNRFQTSSSFTHNAWTSDDGRYLYTTDERTAAYVDVYDVSDPMNVKFINKYRNPDSQVGRVIPHNTYQVENWAVTSWYTDGILITDMTRPDNIVKVGEYDTFYDEASIQNEGTWFYGCWGVYPFLKSGTIIGSDINAGLWVLKPEYKRASYLEGGVYVRNSNGELIAIPNAIVKIVNDRVAEDESDQMGIYKTGLVGEGIYKAYVIHPDLRFDTAFVSLSAGMVTSHDFIVDAQSLKGQVVNHHGDPIPFTSIALVRAGVQSDLITVSDISGRFEVPIFRADSNQLLIASWGYRGKEVTLENINQNLTVVLDEGYEDDFFVDLGWTNPRKAGTGNWERVVPIPTFLDNVIANCPEDYNIDDLGTLCYVTGNGGSNVSENDVDNGLTRLESPLMDFSNSDTAWINLAYWFFNGGGTGTPNDNFKISISNGSQTLDLFNELNSVSAWRTYNTTLTNDMILFTSTMKFMVETQDQNPGHIVEAGFDHFKVDLNQKTTATNDETISALQIYPNITSSTINVKSNVAGETLEICNLDGKIVYRTVLNNENANVDISNLPKGIYFATVKNLKLNTVKIIKL